MGLTREKFLAALSPESRRDFLHGEALDRKIHQLIEKRQKVNIFNTLDATGKNLKEKTARIFPLPKTYWELYKKTHGLDRKKKQSD